MIAYTILVVIFRDCDVTGVNCNSVLLEEFADMFIIEVFIVELKIPIKFTEIFGRRVILSSETEFMLVEKE